MRGGRRSPPNSGAATEARPLPMKAVTWHGKRDVRVEKVPDPRSRSRPTRSSASPRAASAAPTSTSTRCSGRSWSGATSSATSRWASSRRSAPRSRAAAGRPGRRAVQHLLRRTASCATRASTRSARRPRYRDQGKGAALFGYTKLYGEVPGGQAEYLRVPQANYGPIKVPDGPPDDRFVYLSDVLPTAWQAVEYAAIPDGGSVVVLGLGPIGDMAGRVAATAARPRDRGRPRARAPRARPRPRDRGRST